MRSWRSLQQGLLVTLGAVAVSGAAVAAPIVVYPVLDPTASNTMSTVQVTGHPTCSIGAGNCLANAPLAIDAVSVTLDLGASQLLDLNILVQGPGNVVLGGYNGYEKIVFNDAQFQSSGSATLGPGGSVTIAGSVTTSSIELFLAGNFSAIPDLVVLNYSTAPNPNFASGTIGIAGNQLAVSLNGIDIGSFPDPLTGKPATVKADFGFVALVPEPGTAVLCGLGLLMTAAMRPRRSASAHR